MSDSDKYDEMVAALAAKDTRIAELEAELAEANQSADEFANMYLMAENSKNYWKKQYDEESAQSMLETLTSAMQRIAELEAIIKYIDDYAPRADSTCVKPGITLSQAAKNAIDELEAQDAE